MDENNDLINQRPQSLTTNDIGFNAPPGYGDHTFDQLYSEVDLSGCVTPMNASGMSTPFYTQSGAVSEENLGSSDTPTSDDLSASVLHHRLNNIQNTSSRRQALDHTHSSNSHTPVWGSPEVGTGNDHNPHRHSSGRHVVFANPQGSETRRSSSNPLSRRGSEEDHGSSGAQIPQYLESNTSDLSRVPSYGTALKTPLRRNLSADLPNYQTATSQPPSPQPVVSQPSIQAHTAGYFHDRTARSALLPVRRGLTS